MTPTEEARRRPTPDQKERYALRQRLRSCARNIRFLVDEVEAKHGDLSGFYWAGWLAPPSDNSDLRGSQYRPGLLDQWERIAQEAAAGCEESAAFVEGYRAMLNLALHLRQERPPKRDPNRAARAALSPSQAAWVEGRESPIALQPMLRAVLQSPPLREDKPLSRRSPWV